MKIDIFNHVMPVKYLELMKEHAKDPGIIKRMMSLRMLWDIEARVQMLEQWPDLQQVLTLSVPSPELVGGPDLSPLLARTANDGMAEMVKKWPKKLPAFVASLPMNNVPAALEEMDRAIDKLGAVGLKLEFSTHVVRRSARPNEGGRLPAVKNIVAVAAGKGGRVHTPGSARGYGHPELNVEERLVDCLIEQLEALREGAGKDMRLICDLNFNYKTEGYIRIAQALEPFTEPFTNSEFYGVDGQLIKCMSTYITLC